MQTLLFIHTSGCYFRHTNAIPPATGAQGKLLAANNVRPEELPTLSDLRKMGLLPPEPPAAAAVPPPVTLASQQPAQQSLFGPAPGLGLGGLPGLGLGGLPGLNPLLFPIQQPQQHLQQQQLQQQQQQQQQLLFQQQLFQQQQLQGLGLPPPNTMFGPLVGLSQQMQGRQVTIRPCFLLRLNTNISPSMM